jgi:NAD(P)-dependent dehydrogenase (short-subunit alcohol dehydrogenase family)
MTRRHKEIRDEVVAITGGARGIGKATGEAFLRAGARVALGDIDIELVEKTAGELAELTGGDVCGVGVVQSGHCGVVGDQPVPVVVGQHDWFGVASRGRWEVTARLTRARRRRWRGL